MISELIKLFFFMEAPHRSPDGLRLFCLRVKPRDGFLPFPTPSNIVPLDAWGTTASNIHKRTFRYNRM